MPARTRADDRVSTTESKFYLPAGYGPSAVASQLEEVWATMFGQRIEPRT
jgi:hypothetical protein